MSELVKPPDWATDEALAVASEHGWTLHETLPGIFVNAEGKNVDEKGERRDKNGRALFGAAGRKPSKELIEKMQAGRLATGRKGGPVRKKRRSEIAAEIEADKMAALEERAYEVLETQLYSEDETIAQKAAMKVLEYQRGKPVSRVEVDTTEKIVYEVAYAGPPAEIVEGVVVPELESGENDADSS
jgi:hypothetical protein